MAKKVTMDGNAAAAHVAYAFSDVAAIYPITPSSDMGQYSDLWASQGQKNLFNQKVDVIEMQSEAGAAGAVHGSLSAGALTTTFTASQGLLLMIPNMYKIAGEMLPTVFHVSARSLACQSLSIFGDHSDVMSVRNTGFALMAASNIQEIMDLATVSHLATLKSRIPFLNFFDGFRNSHEIQKIENIDYDTLKGLLEMEFVRDFRARALNPQDPKVKVAAQNPDVYFQGRETVNKFYNNLPALISEYMQKVGKVIGRDYKLFDYFGAPDAKEVIVAMGSGCDTIEETINYLNKNGAKVGLVKVRLFRPFAVDALIDVIPQSAKNIIVLDRTKEPGAIGEPLYMDVALALGDLNKKVVGGRYGLSSKEFTPSMIKAVFDKSQAGSLNHGFTVGITDDVTNLSIEVKEAIDTTPKGTICCKFWGLGSDGTVGANKNSIKIIGDYTDMFAQGYFQYDSKKSGGTTRSHLRFGNSPIQSEYLVEAADFIACHNPAYIGRFDLLEGIKENGTFLLNSNFSREEVFSHLTKDMQKTIIKKNIKFYNIDALKISMDVKLGWRINTVMQAAFFIISNILEKDKAIELIKKFIQKTYGKKGQEVVDKNFAAVDAAEAALVQIKVPSKITKSAAVKKLIADDADEFTKNVVEPIMREQGDQITVSQMPNDGCIPIGTTKLEKRGVAAYVPRWLSDKCIQCNQCTMVCPHAAIRAKLIDRADLKNAPEGFETLKAMGKDGEKYDYKIQVYTLDCQSCEACVNDCPKSALEFKAVEEEEKEVENVIFFEKLPNDNLGAIFKVGSIKGSQFKQPLFEFSGACAGCGETPYVKLLTQMFGDRMIIGNATGCSSIYGGTFPSIPYCKNKNGSGPSWANSLFEDNAEYSFGFRLAVDANRKQLLQSVNLYLKDAKDEELASALKKAVELFEKTDEAAIANAMAVRKLLPKDSSNKNMKRIIELKNYFVDKSVWAFGGDGWAYDIGFGGVDHVMASNRNVNILVMDTEVYSNTGGQSSKASQIGSIARFAEAGKSTTKKDLGMMMMSYGYVYVASVAMGYNKMQVLKAFAEAEAYNGPSIILAYSPCINHGFNLANAQQEEKLAVESGYWLTYRYNPSLVDAGKNPLILDSKAPTKKVRELLEKEKRYSALMTKEKEKAEKYWAKMQSFVDDRYKHYLKLATD